MMLPEETARITVKQEPPSEQSEQSAHRSSAASHRQEKGSSRSSGSHYSSSHRDGTGRDEAHHRGFRERDRSYRDRDRDGDNRNFRERNYGGSSSSSSRQRDKERDDRRDRRERRSRSPDEGRVAGRRRHSSRSRSRSKEPRSRDARDHRDPHRSDRSHGSSSSRDAPRERVAQDRLSVEIELELANLRRQHDLKEQLKKEQVKGKVKGAPRSTQGSSSRNKMEVAPFSVVDTPKPTFIPLHSGFGPQSAVEYAPEIQTEEERIEFQRKMQEKLQLHLAAEGKLYPPPSKPSRETPVPTVVSGFANDGSFLEMFKQFQQHQDVAGGVPTCATTLSVALPVAPVPGSSFAPVTDKSFVVPAVGVVAGGVGGIPKIPVIPQLPSIAGGSFKVGTPGVVLAVAAPQLKPSAIEKEPPPPPLPVFGRRRGGKILKTGLVKKVRPIEESAVETPNDPWTLYLQEVKKYKSASCDADSKTRPLVK